jgi:hypothetical protein
MCSREKTFPHPGKKAAVIFRVYRRALQLLDSAARKIMEKRLSGMRDIFREAVEKAKKSGVWEKLTLPQQEELVAKYLQKHFER